MVTDCFIVLGYNDLS